ncbi:UNVERIFIED_ORG: hypothetical protein ABIC54_004466 [Burkholderia sp. 1263]
MTGLVPGLLIGFLLGLFAVCALVALFLLHRPRYVAPMRYNRKWRDKPVPEVVPDWAKGEGVDYRFINLTGEER